MVGVLRDELCALAHFSLHEDGHAAVDVDAFKVDAGDEFKLLAGLMHGFEAVFHLLVEASDDGIDGGAEHVALAFEVEIDGAIGDAGAGGDGADGRVEVAALGDDLNSGFKDALVLVAGGGGGFAGVSGPWCEGLRPALGSLQLRPRSAGMFRFRHCNECVVILPTCVGLSADAR